MMNATLSVAEYAEMMTTILRHLQNAKNNELTITQLMRLMPTASGVDIAVSYARLVELRLVVPVYKFVGNQKPFFSVEEAIKYFEKNNLPKNTGTEVFARLVRTPENTSQNCLDCGGPWPPEKCDHPSCSASVKEKQ